MGIGDSGAGSGGSQWELTLNRTNPIMPTTTSPRPNRLPNFGDPSLDSAKTKKTPRWGYILAEVKTCIDRRTGLFPLNDTLRSWTEACPSA